MNISEILYEQRRPIIIHFVRIKGKFSPFQLGAPTLSKSSSRAAIPPPPPPRPPPPPPSRNILKDLAPLSEKQQKTIEMLKSRPRKRPDWACMMKEVESGRKLKHVQCNDRSAPLIERVNKVKTDPTGNDKISKISPFRNLNLMIEFTIIS